MNNSGKLIAGACALGLAVSSFAATAWFDADIANYSDWPADGSDKAIAEVGTWSGTGAATLAGEAAAKYLALTNANGQLTFMPMAARTLVEKTVTVTASIKYTAYDEDELPAIPAEMKSGLCLAEDATGNLHWWGVRYNEEGGTNEWVLLTATGVGAPTAASAVTVTVEVGSRVRYAVNGEALSVGGKTSFARTSGGAATVSEMSLCGRGELQSLTGASDDAKVAEIGSNTFPTLAAALAAAADGETVTLLDDISLTAGLTYDAGKRLTLDLNGNTLSYPTAETSAYMMTVCSNDTLVVTNGTLSTSGRGVIVAGSLTLASGTVLASACRSLHIAGVSNNWDFATGTGRPANVTIAAGATVIHGNGDGVAIFIRGSADPRLCYQSKAILDVYGTVIDNSLAQDFYGLTGNGGNATLAEINFYDGSVYTCTNADCPWMMWIPSADLNLYGGTITSAGQGIMFLCGRVNVPQDSTVKVIANGAGANALILDRTTQTYPRFVYTTYPTSVPNEIAATIAGGEFTSAGTAIVSMASDAKKTAVGEFVSGGLFSTELATDCVIEGFKTVASATKSGYYEIGPDAVAGTGASDDPWVIDGRRHLKAFRNGVNDGTYATDGKFVRQTADIDLRGEQWTEIGTGLTADSGRAFNATYDGENHVISNFVLSGASYCGFFRATECATFRNLRLLDVKSPDGCGAVSILAGDVEPKGEQKVVIDNVTVGGTITGSHNVGGFAAWLEGTVEILNSTNLAKCTTTYAKVGGFAPYYKGTGADHHLLVSNCCNKGTVTLAKSVAGDATFAVGGILSYAASTNAVIFLDCVNEGAVIGTIEVKDASTEKYFGTSYLGGLLGYVSGNLPVTFSNCVSCGAISANVANVAQQNAAVGGFLGGLSSSYAKTKVVLTDVTVTMAVTLAATVNEERSAWTGAFVGYNLAYDETTGAGVSLLGKAPTALMPVGRADLAVGGYKSTATEGDYTLYLAAAPSPIPSLPAEPTADDVTNAVQSAGFTDPAVAEVIGTNATTYADFKEWSETVPGGATAVVASPHAAASYQLSDVVSLPLLFENEPELKIESLEALTGEDAGKWSIAISLKDGQTDIALIQAKIAEKVKVSTDLSNWNGATTTVESNTIKVTPPAGDKAFLKVEVGK